MARGFFHLSQNSRHRTAVLALYRALVKTAKRVPLPNWEQHPGHVHPVIHVLRKRVAKHKTYDSLRLSYASLAAGYRYLTLLTKAQDPSTPEHGELVQHLRHLATPPKPKSPIRELKPRVPLVVKVSGPGEPSQYATTQARPRPKASFSGDRKIPQLTATAKGVPFLRIKKPQPRVLSRAIARKNWVMNKRAGGVSKADEEMIPAGKSEDVWEKLVQKQMRSEGFDQLKEDPGFTESYEWSAQLSKRWFELKIEETWQDFVARGKALYEVVEQEELMAKREQRNAHTNSENSEIISTHSPKTLGIQDIMSSPDAMGSRVEKQVFNDPFQSEKWARTVRNLELRLGRGSRTGWDARTDSNVSSNSMPWPKDIKETRARNTSRAQGHSADAEDGFSAMKRLRKGHK